MAESHVVKSGDISLYSKGFMKSSWLTKFCVLHSASPESHPYMELFESKESFMKSKSNPSQKIDVKRIDLHNVKTIKTSNKGNCEFIIELRIKRDKYMLMVNSPQQSADWFTKLNNTANFSGAPDENSLSQEGSQIAMNDNDEVSVNPMYESSDQADRFEVEVTDSQLAKMCGIVGRKSLLISGSDVAFQDMSTREIKCNFGFAMMRRFGRKDNTVSIEVGRKCPNGEGQVVMKSEFAKSIHEILTKNSKSVNTRSSMRPSSNEEKHQSETTPDVGDENISAPVMVQNMYRQHPGQKQLTVTPLRPNAESNNSTADEPLKNSNGTAVTNDRGSIKVTEDYKKSLESKLHSGPPELLKKDSKHKKEDKKEKQKEKEKIEKEKGDHDKSKNKFGFFSKKEKKEENKDDDRGGDKGKVQKSLSLKDASERNLYDVPDVDMVKHEKHETSGDSLYDEPIVKTKTDSKKSKLKKATTFEDSTTKSMKETNQTHEPAEYAQPVKPDTSSRQMYSDVQAVRGDAWKIHGRSENEEIHTEQYASLQSARTQMQNAPPPIPFRQYDAEDEVEEDEGEGLYNRVNLRTSGTMQDKAKPQEDHIYGQACGSVNQLPTGMVLVPQAGKGSSDSESEGLYEEAEYDVCGSTVQTVAAIAAASAKPIAATGGGGRDYEEAVIAKPLPPHKPSLPKQPAPKTKQKKTSEESEGLYEDVC